MDADQVRKKVEKISSIERIRSNVDKRTGDKIRNLGLAGVKVDEDTVWLNRQQLALLFGRDIKTIGKHVGNALREELNGFSVVDALEFGNVFIC